MAKKETYFSKHKAQLAAERPLAFSKEYRATAEQQEKFAAGEVLLINKPLHWTSFDVVRKIRNSIGIKKVGHAGTLDPLATGLLIVCTGKATKQINEHMAATKKYTGSITLGAVTPTYDLESEPENFQDISCITTDKIIQASQNLSGEIDQFPPIYSAIKKDGEALYMLARRGESIELKARPVTIHDFSITAINLPVIDFSITCSTGTYIRSLAHDMGQILGCGGYLSLLCRTAIGDKELADAYSMEEFLAQFPESQRIKKDN